MGRESEDVKGESQLDGKGTLVDAKREGGRGVQGNVRN